ncbi:MAG: OadG family protein [Firmicutes bacterium]|nr:OadG family protein [Bacillota bacterium]
MLLAISNGLVVGMGLGVVFFGLICIIFLIWIMGKIMNVLVKDKAPETKSAAPVVRSAAPASASAGSDIPNRPEFVAAVSAAIAEELGTEINKIQIVSIKKI